MKIDRQKVYNKYNGHCSYCGGDINFDSFQVDHYWPRHLSHESKMDNDRFGNLMPSCQKCNIHKHGLRPEKWRSELQRQISMLKKNAQFDRALRFGQVVITEKPILFYFERLAVEHGKSEVAAWWR